MISSPASGQVTVPLVTSAGKDDRTRATVAVFVLLAFAGCARLAVLALLNSVSSGQEINDDYRLYEIMIRQPLLLVTGEGFRELGDGGIYAPLVPLQLWFPGKLISHFTGPMLGRRLGMLVYDLIALGIALRVAFHVAGAPRSARQWAVAILLAILPVSIGASVVWGQEDTAAAMWSAAALAAFVYLGPLTAMIVAGAGLFTSKMFFVVLMLGIWLAAPRGQQRRVALAGAGSVVAFGLFLLARWKATGVVYPDYHYNAMSNSPSIWAAYYLLIDPIKFDDPIRPYVKLVVATAMIVFTCAAWLRRGKLTVWGAVVASHAVFFASFIGIHPEHYLWFLPFLIVFAWDAYRRGRVLLFVLATGLTYLTYAYKVVYGLRGPPGFTASGKQSIRNFFEQYAGFDLYWIQTALVFVILGSLLLLAREALKPGTSVAATE